MSEQTKVGRYIFIWSGQPTEEYQNSVPMAKLRKNLEVCKRCGRTVDCALVGLVDEQAFQDGLDYLRAYVANQDCEDHHLP